MFSINDADSPGDDIEIQVKQYAEVNHTHVITDIEELEARLEAIEAKLEELSSDNNITIQLVT